MSDDVFQGLMLVGRLLEGRKWVPKDDPQNVLWMGRLEVVEGEFKPQDVRCPYALAEALGLGSLLGKRVALVVTPRVYNRDVSWEVRGVQRSFVTDEPAKASAATR